MNDDPGSGDGSTNDVEKRWHDPAMVRSAVTYVVDRAHEQYAGKLTPEQLLGHVRGSVGRSGANAEYVLNTVSQMKSLGVRDATLEWLAERLGEEVRPRA